MNWLAGALVALLVVGGFSAPAMAAGGKFTVQAPKSGETHNGLPVLVEGQTYELKFGYGIMDDGEIVRVTLPEGVSIPESALVVQPGNKVVESLVMDGGELVVTFKSPFPYDGTNQGTFGMQFTLDTVENAEVRELVWGVNGEPSAYKVIVTTPDNKPEVTNTWSDKQVDVASLPHTIEDGKVVLDPAVLDQVFTYTVRVSSEQAREVTLTDTLDSTLEFVQGSLSGDKVVRDENGMTPSEAPLGNLPDIGGTKFSHEFAAEANSLYTFTYKAKIAGPEALDQIRASLQSAYDELDKEAGGTYSTNLRNTATIAGGRENRFGGDLGSVKAAPSPGTGKAFTKAVDPGNVALDEKLVGGAKLSPAIDLTYTLGADLTVFADFANNEKHKLQRNLVIEDKLRDPVKWNTDAADFLSLVDAAGAPVALTEAKGITQDFAQAIAADEYKFNYVIDGQNLFVNLGQDVSQKYTLTIKATLSEMPTETVDGTLYLNKYRADNQALFTYADGKREDKWATTVISTPKDLTGEVINDPQKFAKTTSGGTATVEAGTSIEVPYTFTVGANIGDASGSSIVDSVDHDVFNVTEENLDAIAKTITGSYGAHPLDGSKFTLELVKGKLVIAPNAAFKAMVNEGAANADAPLLEAWTMHIKLPTHVLNGKQTLEIKNSATYEGHGLEYDLTSSSSTKASSYGDEMEVRKHVYAGKGKFTTNFRAEIDEESGELLKDEFTYRVELEPHGTFDSMVFDVEDVLPSQLEFLGFVAKADIDGDSYDKSSTYRIPGSSLTVNYDKPSNTLTIPKGDLESGKTVSLFFKVKLVDYKKNIGVTNLIGTSGATITPTNEYPLSLLKRDSVDASKLITDAGARFSVLKEDKTSVEISDLRVENGKIVTADGGTPVVAKPGTYWLREDVAPAGYKKTDELLQIGFKADDSAKEVVLYNDRQNYAIGDFTWIDANRDGIQDEGEEILPGVKVELVRDGEVIAETTTDENGRYLFDELPAGTYQVKFTLTDEQKQIYTFTDQQVGEDGTVDSNADRKTGLSKEFVLDGTNKSLTKDYEYGTVKATEGIDPTWDAGVVLKTYAIGDFTWIDANRDGIQDEGDDILPGVTVELLKDGVVIDTTTTDENGRYMFDELEAGEYEVKFTLTEEQQKVYRFTEQNSGSDVAADSDADPTSGLTTKIVLGDSNKSLTKDYEHGTVKATEGIDPTWDAGVIKKSWAIGDYTWIDNNRDGIQDEGDDILPGVTVELLKDGVVIETTTTDENGYYLFDELEAGEYQVKFTLTDDQKKVYTFTDKQVGDDGAADSDADRKTGLTTTIVLGDENPNLTKDYEHGTVTATEGIDPTWDAGVVLKTYAIGDYTWIDANRDGIQDAGEKVLPGVTVELLKDGVVIDTTTTDENGHYMFDELLAGEYEVKFTLTEEQQKIYTFTTKVAGKNDAADSDADRKTGLTAKIVLGNDNPNLTHDYSTAEVKATEGIDPTWDAGVVLKSYAIGDVVWIDTNKDGIQDSSEKVLPGVTVELFKDGKVIAKTTTDKNGRYIFDELMAGEYEVKFTLTKEQQKVYKFTKQHAGSSDAADSNADPKTGFTVKIVLNDDNANLTLDYEYGTVLATQGIDPTWDAGVIVLDIATAVDPGTPGVNELPSTGGSLPLTLGGIALALLAAGASLMFWRRRTA